MYEYDYDEVDGLSLLDIMKLSFGTNKKTRIRFGIILLAIVVITYLAIGVFYNGRKADYTANFQYQIPSLIENESNGEITSVSYLDGSPFNVNSLVTIERLKEVKNSDSDFSNIDVENMYENTHIKATFSGTGAYQYSISARERYFSNVAQAKKFFSALIQLPMTVTSNLVESIDNSLYLNQAIIENNTLNVEINNLINQASHISNTYNTLISNMSRNNKSKVLIDDSLVDVSDLKVIAEAKIENMNLNQLLTEVESNHYVRNYSNQKVKDELTKTYNNYVAEASELQKKIDNYKSMIQAGTMINANYDNYIKCMDRKVVVDYQVEVYDGFLNHGVESSDFEKKLSNVVSELRSITEELTKVQKATYQDESNTIYFAKNSIVATTGSISTIVVIAMSIVFGLLVASIVNIVLGYKKYKDEKKCQKATENSENE